MSAKEDRLAALADDLTARRAIDVAATFTPDFRLHDPAAGPWPVGHAGARKMLDGILAFAPDVEVAIVDMVEENDRVAVRWRVSGTRDGERVSGAIVAIYRFEGALIAEDWGVSVRAPWPD